MYSKEVEAIVSERDDLIQKEIDIMLGAYIKLNDNELKANDIIMELKLQELDIGFHHPNMFNLSKHFFDYKDEIKKTDLFKIIQQMPKGAVLHAHDTGLLSPDYVLEITYLPNLFVCFGGESPRFQFSKNAPDTTCETKWVSVKEARYASDNIEDFDDELRKNFTVVIDKPKETYNDINTVWKKFEQCFKTIEGLLTYKPVWEMYFHDTLKAFREDNVMFIEIRSDLPHLYNLNGQHYDSLVTAKCCKKVTDQFVKNHPDFYGAKLIYAPGRSVDVQTVKEYLNIAKKLKKALPDFFAGFDLVGQEDTGAPLKKFLPELVEAGKEFDFYFHAGETNWHGTSSDENLADAIVLGSKRIGHAFSLVKHPVLLQEVIKRDIAIEVNVISNTVLKLVEDVRNHPLAHFLAHNVPVVLSSDDPGIWEAEPMSHDFYVAFVGVANRSADIRLLKQLALNSLYYSSLPTKQKIEILQEFEMRWARFIDSVVREKWCKVSV